MKLNEYVKHMPFHWRKVWTVEQKLRFCQIAVDAAKSKRSPEFLVEQINDYLGDACPPGGEDMMDRVPLHTHAATILVLAGDGSEDVQHVMPEDWRERLTVEEKLAYCEFAIAESGTSKPAEWIMAKTDELLGTGPNANLDSLPVARHMATIVLKGMQKNDPSDN